MDRLKSLKETFCETVLCQGCFDLAFFFFRDVVCGSAFNLALSEIKGMVQMWGIYTTNKETHPTTRVLLI
jgi:hypothetical protein